MPRPSAPRPRCARVLAGLGVALAVACAPREEPRRPDVFLFVVDTLRADRLGCYGYPRPTSPNLDRLAAEGALFLDANAQCSWTKPSMVSLFQGRYVTQYRDVFDEDAPTLAEVLQAAGYRTLGVVGNVLLAERTGFGRGFDHYDARRNPARDRRPGEPDRPVDVLVRDLWPEIGALAAAGDERPPLFVYVHAMDPHHPYLEHPELDGELPLDGAPPLAEWQRARFAELGPEPAEDDPDWRAAWREMQLLRGLYDREVRFTDAGIGRMLERLRAAGLLEHALVAVVADHGEVLFDQATLKPESDLARLAPDEFFHREHGSFLYQSLIGTPFLLRGAGVPRGVRVAEPVENVDLFPTLLELLDLPAPPGLHGRSLVGALHGRAPAREAVHAFVMQNVSVREVASGLKLTLPTPVGETLGARPTLFDLGADPGETRDLAAERPGDVERLRARIEAWRAAHPTVSSLKRPLDEREFEDLREMGYVGEDEED